MVKQRSKYGQKTLLEKLTMVWIQYRGYSPFQSRLKNRSKVGQKMVKDWSKYNQNTLKKLAMVWIQCRG